MKVFFKAMLFFGVVQIGASAPGTTVPVVVGRVMNPYPVKVCHLCRAVKPRVEKQGLEVVMQELQRRLMECKEENVQLRKQNADEWARWELWAGGIIGYTHYLENKCASLEQASLTFQQQYDLLRTSQEASQEPQADIQPSLESLWASTEASVWGASADDVLGDEVDRFTQSLTLAEDPA